MNRKPNQKEIDRLQPVEINSVNDIRKAVAPFLKEVPDTKVNFSADVDWVDDGGVKRTTTVDSYSSEPSMRKGLLEGFEHVKENEEMWNKLHDALEEDEYATTLPNVDIDNVRLPVDRIIEKRLGGKREGMTIVWHLGSKKIVFDPYEKTLKEHEYDPSAN